MEQTPIDSADTFSLVAELAVALAGFTGIAATFGGRGRQYSEADKVRVEGIFLASASVLAISLCVLTLGRTGLRIEAVYAIGGIPGAVFLARFLYPLTPHAYQMARDDASTTSLGIVTIGTIQALLTLALIFGNAILWRTDWPLFAAASIQLLWSLLLFARLLVRPN